MLSGSPEQVGTEGVERKGPSLSITWTHSEPSHRCHTALALLLHAAWLPVLGGTPSQGERRRVLPGLRGFIATA